MKPLCLIAIAFLLFSGCSEPPQERPSHSPANEPETGLNYTNAGVTTDQPISPALRPSGFALTDCIGITANFEWPLEQGPGKAPKSWEQQLIFGGVGSSELVEVFACGRVSWGSFERPMTILFESHSKADVPAQCESESLTWIVNSIWTSDAEFADFLETTYGVPTHVTAFSFAFENSTQRSSIAWKWNTEGSESSLTVEAALPEPQASPLTISYRYAWDSGNGVTIVDVNVTAQVPTSPEQVAHGNLYHPMMHESGGTDLFLGQGDYFSSLNSLAKITEFGDYVCGN